MSNSKKIYFASDFHFGIPDKETSIARERRLCKWLDEIKHDAGKLIGIGSGGNINKIHKMTRYKNDHALSLDKLTQLHKEVSTLSYEDRIRELDLNPDRADVIVPAAEIFLKVLKGSFSHPNFIKPENHVTFIKDS